MKRHFATTSCPLPPPPPLAPGTAPGAAWTRRNPGAGPRIVAASGLIAANRAAAAGILGRDPPGRAGAVQGGATLQE